MQKFNEASFGERAQQSASLLSASKKHNWTHFGNSCLIYFQHLSDFLVINVIYDELNKCVMLL